MLSFDVREADATQDATADLEVSVNPTLTLGADRGSASARRNPIPRRRSHTAVDSSVTHEGEMAMPAIVQCKECGSEMSFAPLGPIEGEERGLRMTIDGLPALQCRNGHRRFVEPTFP